MPPLFLFCQVPACGKLAKICGKLVENHKNFCGKACGKPDLSGDF